MFLCCYLDFVADIALLSVNIIVAETDGWVDLKALQLSLHHPVPNPYTRSDLSIEVKDY